MRSIKRVLAVLAFFFIATIATFGFSSVVNAGELNSIESEPISFEPFWSHTASIFMDLHINNRGRATMTASVVGNTGTTRISVNVALLRVNPNGTTTTIATFNNISQNGVVWLWERPHYVARGHNYQWTLTATVFRNGTSETITHRSRIVRAN